MFIVFLLDESYTPDRTDPPRSTADDGRNTDNEVVPVEYAGWDDRIEHVELEVRDHDERYIDGDWIVFERGENPHRVRV